MDSADPKTFEDRSELGLWVLKSFVHGANEAFKLDSHRAARANCHLRCGCFREVPPWIDYFEWSGVVTSVLSRFLSAPILAFPHRMVWREEGQAEGDTGCRHRQSNRRPLDLQVPARRDEGRPQLCVLSGPSEARNRSSPTPNCVCASCLHPREMPLHMQLGQTETNFYCHHPWTQAYIHGAS